VHSAHSIFTQGTRVDLSARLTKLSESIPSVIEGLNAEQFEKEYPRSFSTPMSIGEFLIHLYGHLNWRLGQVDYLRRMLIKDEALG
jgi:hypothetical protein